MSAVAARRLPGGDVGLWLPYELRERAKALPGARWEADERRWRIPQTFAAEAFALVDELTEPADVEDAVSKATTRLLEALPDDLRTATWRALATAWHPDRGGDNRVMRALIPLRPAS